MVRQLLNERRKELVNRTIHWNFVGRFAVNFFIGPDITKKRDRDSGPILKKLIHEVISFLFFSFTGQDWRIQPRSGDNQVILARGKERRKESKFLSH